MSDRAQKFIAFRHCSKVQKALAMSALEIEVVDHDENEILDLRDSLSHRDARDFDYNDSITLI